MKVLFCAKCFDIRAFEEKKYTACKCGNMEAMWADAASGSVVVHAIIEEYARIIGMNNQVLSRVNELAQNGGYDFGNSVWKEIHTDATQAPGYLFDAESRRCWAVIIAIGNSADVKWAEDQKEWQAKMVKDRWTILVNGKEVEHVNTKITYREIVQYTYGDNPSFNLDEAFPTVTYGRGPDQNREGSLHHQSPPIDTKAKMHFNCIFTGNA